MTTITAISLYVLVVAIIVISFVYAGHRARRRHIRDRLNQYASGGYVSPAGERRFFPHGGAVIGREDFEKFRSALKERLLGARRSFSPATRKTLEVLDRMQEPAVAAAIMPEQRIRFTMHGRNVCLASTEVTSEFGLNPADIFADLTGISHDDPYIVMMREHCDQPVYQIAGFDAEGRVISGQMIEAAKLRERLSRSDAEMDAFFDPEAGEPLTLPPAPNIGGEDHPPYEGPNYTTEEEIADEMKTVIHTGKDN